jgi:hypothetical protein
MEQKNKNNIDLSPLEHVLKDIGSGMHLQEDEELTLTTDVIKIIPKGTTRLRKRFAVRAINEFELYCNSLVNKYFKWLNENPVPIKEAQTAEIIKLDNFWKNWLKSKGRFDKYSYEQSADFFLKKLRFYMGTKKQNEELLSKIEALQNSTDANLPL